MLKSLAPRITAIVVSIGLAAVLAYASPKPGEYSHKQTYLGVQIRNVTPDRAADLKLKDDSGVEIVTVDRDAPAGHAGLQEGDAIVSFNGEKIESAEQFRRLIHETSAGKIVQLGISRGGQPTTISVKLGTRLEVEGNSAPVPSAPGAFGFTAGDIEFPHFNVVQTSSRFGLMVESLTPQLGEFLGVRNAAGVLVRSVEKGSGADAAGLKAGDVIVRVNNDAVVDMGDWRRLMRKPEGKTNIGIVREKREQSVTLDVQPGKYGSSLEYPDIKELTGDISVQLSQLRPALQEALDTAEATLEAHQAEIDRAMNISQKEVQRALDQVQKSLPSCKSK